MPSFYMILHSKIWQRLRWDPDNHKEQPEVINASQAYSPLLTVFLQKEAMGNKGKSSSTSHQKLYWWKSSFWELIYKCLELPIAEVLAN